MLTKVLVTGGAGYIGSHTCKALAAAGFEPIVYDNLVHGHEWAVKWGPLVRGDILDPDSLREAFKEFRPRAVLHFAAFLDVGESVREPQKYFKNNVEGSRSLLKAMQEFEVPHLVFSSTCATYGEPQQIPIPEDHPQNPINPYGETKLQVEKQLWDLDQTGKLKSIALRYFNAAGADPDAEIGEAHLPEIHLIPLVLDAAAGRRKDIKIFGTDYPTPDGTCIRDYIHVSDLAEAHVKALQKLQQGGGSCAYNLGNGKGFSVREVIECAQKVTQKPIRIEETERRPGDPPKLVGRCDRASRELGWQQKYDKLETIIESAWTWHQKHFGSK